MEIKDFLKPGFFAAFRKLAQQDLPIKKTWELKTLMAQVDEEFKKFQELNFELRKKYIEKLKNKKPKLKIKKNGKLDFDIEKDEEYLKEFEQLLQIKIDVKKIEIKVDDIGEGKMSFADLENLKSLVNFL